MGRRLKMYQSAGVFVSLALLCAAAGALRAQTLQITSPADGSVVHSGQTLTVTVKAD